MVHRKIDRLGEKRRYRERETGEKDRGTEAQRQNEGQRELILKQRE